MSRPRTLCVPSSPALAEVRHGFDVVQEVDARRVAAGLGDQYRSLG